MRIECFMEGDAATREMPLERQAKEDLRRHIIQHQSGRVLKAEFYVVKMDIREAFRGIVVTEVRGRGKHKGIAPQRRAGDYRVEYLLKMKI